MGRIWMFIMNVYIKFVINGKNLDVYYECLY
jgi:hypothetical protein